MTVFLKCALWNNNLIKCSLHALKEIEVSLGTAECNFSEAQQNT